MSASTTVAPIIIIDDREPDISVRLQTYGLDAAVARLEWGDYAFYPHNKVALIERKTVSDLLGSMSSGRLQAQLHGMVDHSDIAFLMRDGPFRRSPSGCLAYYAPRDPRKGADDWVESGWSWDSFAGVMIDIQLLGIGFIDCPLLGEYPTELARIVINTCKEDHKWLRERTRPDVITLDQQYRNAVWALAAHDGIGPEIADALLNAFGSEAEVVRVAATDPDTLAKTKVGRAVLGKIRARRFHEEVCADWKSAG